MLVFKIFPIVLLSLAGAAPFTADNAARHSMTDSQSIKGLFERAIGLFTLKEKNVMREMDDILKRLTIVAMQQPENAPVIRTTIGKLLNGAAKTDRILLLPPLLGLFDPDSNYDLLLKPSDDAVNQAMQSAAVEKKIRSVRVLLDQITLSNGAYCNLIQDASSVIDNQKVVSILLNNGLANHRVSPSCLDRVMSSSDPSNLSVFPSQFHS